ncbi:hypothetical protein BN2364_3586 [Alloalcanivorax xenomutans]|nr:hypothetical protein BN2364_3586 [Alloalcanivorax xenomutans]
MSCHGGTSGRSGGGKPRKRARKTPSHHPAAAHRDAWRRGKPLPFGPVSGLMRWKVEHPSAAITFPCQGASE